MATEVGKGVVPVTFDKNQIGRDLSSSIDDGAKRSEGAIGSTFKRLAGIATAAFSVVAIGSFVKDSVDAARESNKIAAQTEAVIASTGGAAKVTAGQFSDLATAISLKTGIDDEQIQAGENLLATFTNIRNEVGAGNDIFSQATKIAVDMGVALGGDASSNAIQLGKALNDPIRGLTALTRVGVTFSDEQRAQITTMQEHGDMLGAQKVLLAELNKEFGGSAEATATAGAKWGVFWGNLQEKFGNLLIPALDATAEWAMTTLPNAFGFLQDAIGPVLSALSDDWGSLVNAFQAGDTFGFSTSDGLLGWFIVIGATMRDVWDVAAEFFSTLTTGFTNQDAATGAESLALILRDDLWPIIQSITGFMADNWQPILLGLAVAFGLLTAPITTITVGLITLYVRSQLFRDIVQSVGEGLVSFGEFAMDVFHVLQDSLGPAFLAIGASLADLARFFADRWDKIRGSVVTVLNIIKIAIAVALAPALLAWKYFHDQIMAVVKLAWDQISLVVQTGVRIIGDIFDFVTSILLGQWGDAWDAVKDIFGAAVDFITGSFGNLLGFIVDFFSSLPANILTALGDLTTTLGPKAWELLTGLLVGIKDAFVAVDEWWRGLPLVLLGFFIGAIDWLTTSGKDIVTGVITGLWQGFTDVVIWFSELPGKLKSWFADAATWLVGAGKDIVAGIIKGIRDAGPGIISALADQVPVVGWVHSQTTSQDEGNKAILGHARGGIFDHPTFGMFGEAGREVILPLTNAQRTWELAGRSGLIDVLAKGMPRHELSRAHTAALTSVSAQSATIVVPVSIDGREFARVTAPYNAEAIRTHDRALR